MKKTVNREALLNELYKSRRDICSMLEENRDRFDEADCDKYEVLRLKQFNLRLEGRMSGIQDAITLIDAL